MIRPCRQAMAGQFLLDQVHVLGSSISTMSNCSTWELFEVP